MRRLSAVMTAGLWGIVWAQAPRTPEPLAAWPYFKQVQPVRNHSGLFDLVLDLEILDKARTDQADLRLYDGGGQEIPYVLRVRRETETSNVSTARDFNRAVEGGSAQLSCDLGERPEEHNEVEIVTAGNNFRRLADVEGSSDGLQWSTLISGAILFRFTAEGGTVKQEAVSYPVSRYRYVRVKVSRDPQVDRTAPEIETVRVRRSIHLKGEAVPFTAAVEGREADRVNGRPASVWRIDLGGRIPVHRLVIDTGFASFSRPFRLEAIDDPAAPVALASGELTRREDPPAPAAIEFREHFARRLKLTVTDDRNAPLVISGVTAPSAARQLMFPSGSVGAGPLRLYYGNPKALAPHYDLAARLPVDPADRPVRLALGLQESNPIYRPEPKPLSERSPWLVYAVLAAACVALAAILVNLARTSSRPAAQPE